MSLSIIWLSTYVRPFAITAGEPAGIGAEIVLRLANSELCVPIVVIADTQLLQATAQRLGIELQLQAYDPNHPPKKHIVNQLPVVHTPLAVTANPGELDQRNANYVIKMLDTAIDGCLEGRYAAMVTAPINKDVINQSGLTFFGHTGYLAQRCQCSDVVMMLATKTLRVALTTTHIPLSEVASSITVQRILQTLTTIESALRTQFKIKNPRIAVCGLNPHAGEKGYLGREEIEIISPAIQQLTDQGMCISGPFPADTIFLPSKLIHYDAVLAMYHDQGLPVLKTTGFGNAVNITLGLPIVRTSVDHGTALDIAGKGIADIGSLRYALQVATEMAA